MTATNAGDLSDEEIVEMDADMARGVLDSIQRLLDDGGIPRGTFADDQVRNLVALYNQRGEELQRRRRAEAASITGAGREEIEEQARGEGMDIGANEALKILAAVLGVKDWEGGDGTETWDGDVRVEVYNILKAARVYDDEDGVVARIDDEAAAIARTRRETIEAAITETKKNGLFNLFQRLRALADPAPGGEKEGV